MGEHNGRRARPPLKLKKQSLRVLGWDELGQVVGGVRDVIIVKGHVKEQRSGTRYCMEW